MKNWAGYKWQDFIIWSSVGEYLLCTLLRRSGSLIVRIYHEYNDGGFVIDSSPFNRFD